MQNVTTLGDHKSFLCLHYAFYIHSYSCSNFYFWILFFDIVDGKFVWALLVFYQISIHVFLSCLVLVWYFIPINFWLFSFITSHNFTGRVWKRTLNKTLTQQDELEGEWYTGLVLFWSIVDSLYIVYQLLITDCYTTGFFISANNVNKDGRRWSTLILSGNVY